jgi:putative ABC transport system permease protein
MRGLKSAAFSTGHRNSSDSRPCWPWFSPPSPSRLSARRYMQRHLDGCAVMRCLLGITQSGLIRLHSGLFLWLALLAAALGCMTGFAIHFVLVSWLAELLDLRLPLPGWLPLFQGAAVAAVLLFGFAFPPLLQLSKVPTLRVFRRELGPPRPFLLGGYALGVLLLAGLLLLVSGDLRLGGFAIGGFAGALIVFWLVARLSVRLVSRLRGGGGFGLAPGAGQSGTARRGEYLADRRAGPRVDGHVAAHRDPR